MYLPRILEDFFVKASTQFPVMLLSGARQVGKTTFLRHIMQKNQDLQRRYVTLDDPLILNLAKEDTALFLKRYPAPVIIDEIQYAPELLPYIKMAVDQQRTPGQFWLTGSQQFHLMKGVSESLAGRVGIVQLLGLSQRELSRKIDDTPFMPFHRVFTTGHTPSLQNDLATLYHSIWRGSFPAIATDASLNRELFYSSYVQTYLQRDIRDLAKVGDEMAFFRFLRATAARTAQLLNLAELARDADIAPNTAKQWLSILQASNLVYLLEPYFNNVTKRLVKTPKLYFLDTGLCAWLTEWSSPATLEAGAMSGAIFETWVVTELLKSWYHRGLRAPFYFYRDKDQKEVDLLISQDGTLYPIEIKKSASPNKSAIRHFAALHQLGLPIGPGGVICLVSEPLPLDEQNWAIPAALL
jgi:uncharacterized protein